MGISAGLCSDERAAHSTSRTSRYTGCAAPVYCCNLVLEQSHLLSGWGAYHAGDGNWVRRTPVGTATPCDSNIVRGKPVTARLASSRPLRAQVWLFDSFRGLKLVPSKWRCLVPPISPHQGAVATGTPQKTCGASRKPLGGRSKAYLGNS